MGFIFAPMGVSREESLSESSMELQLDSEQPESVKMELLLLNFLTRTGPEVMGPPRGWVLGVPASDPPTRVWPSSETVDSSLETRCYTYN